MTSPALPIDAVLPDVTATLRRTPNLVLAAPPGAGKTTRVPLALIGADWLGDDRILMLEPRRIATRAAAERLATGLGETVGERVGYRIRGETRTGPAVQIEVVTEGILTRMLQDDPELAGIGCILFDEIHERSIHADLGLALALDVQQGLRPDLRLVVMSATLDTARFAALMGDAEVIESPGRQFPITTHWLDRPWRTPGAGRRGFEQAAADLVVRALRESEGDLLVFLPGAGEIDRVGALLRSRIPEVTVQPLHGSQPFRQQRAALQPANDGTRRVVLATAIAETSVTVPGVRVVVDAGLARRPRTDPATGLTRLVTVPVSRAEAVQRRGRAGRLGPGLCYRMWAKGEEGGLPPFAPPEILETDLAPLALELAQWGVSEPRALRFLDVPPAAAYRAAQDLMRELGALDARDRITAHGRALAGLPVHPRLAHVLVRADASGEQAEAAVLAAILSERDPLRGPGRPPADLGLRIRAVISGSEAAADRATVARIRAEARRLGGGKCDPRRAEMAAGRLTALAYPDRIALRRPGDAPRYLLSGGRGAVLDAADPLAGQRLLVATDLEDGPEARIRIAAPISEADLRREFRDRIRQEESVRWSSRHYRVEARRRERLGALVLSDEPWRNAPSEQIGAALALGIRERGIAALPWPDAARRLRYRVAWARRQNGPQLTQLPDLSDAALLASLETWLLPHLDRQKSLEALGTIDLTAVLRAQFDWETASALDRIAPETFRLPSGRAVPVDYTGDAPAISAKVQELFGTTDHPTIGAPPVPPVVNLLSPANRPVQTTADLPGFWKSSYQDVRKDMRARYPKHAWPEDPASATATTDTRRRPARKPRSTEN